MGARGSAARHADRQRAATERAEVAHVLRRTTFGPFPGDVDSALDDVGSVDALLERQLAAEPLPFDAPAGLDQPFDPAGSPTNQAMVDWWFARMVGGHAGLHEKLTWFWHGHFATVDGGISVLAWRQLRTLHQHATGNLRDLVQALVVDPALLSFLDGDKSDISSPNENLARELMELFTLGRGAFTEADVRAAARSLSGWRIDLDTLTCRFHPEVGPSAPDRFLGRTGRFGPAEVVDQIFAQPALAPFIVRKLWKAFVGGPPDDRLVARWADAFRADDFEILPLVRRMLRSDAFADARLSRPRSGLEWATVAYRAARIGPRPAPSELFGLGQVPYFPPNVAGWPDEAGWVSPGSFAARGSYLARHPFGTIELDGPDRAAAALRWCGVEEPSPASTAALEALDRALLRDPERNATLVRAVLLFPELAQA